MNQLVTATAASVCVDQRRRIDAAVAALAPNTRKRLRVGVVRVAGMGRRSDVAHGTPGSSRRCPRGRRLAGHRAHRTRRRRQGASRCQVLAGPTADGLMQRRAAPDRGARVRDRGHGQVAGIGWAHAEAAASLASNGGDSLRGIRDGAILRVMSDTLARIGFMIGAGLRVHHASRSAIRRTERAEDPEQAPAPRRAAGPSPCRAAAYSPAPPIGHTTGAPPARRCAPVRCRSPARSRIGTAQCTGFHRGRPPGCMFTQRTG